MIKPIALTRIGQLKKGYKVYYYSNDRLYLCDVIDTSFDEQIITLSNGKSFVVGDYLHGMSWIKNVTFAKGINEYEGFVYDDGINKEMLIAAIGQSELEGIPVLYSGSYESRVEAWHRVLKAAFLYQD